MLASSRDILTAFAGMETRSCGDETQPDTSVVSGCVGFLRKRAPTLRSSRAVKARFVRKVSSFFQVTLMSRLDGDGSNRSKCQWRAVSSETVYLTGKLRAATRKDYLAELLTVPLLIIDDLGMRKLAHTAAEDLLELIMRRYERASTLLISNRPVDDRGKLLGDIAVVTALRTGCRTMRTSSSAARAVGDKSADRLAYGRRDEVNLTGPRTAHRTWPVLACRQMAGLLCPLGRPLIPGNSTIRGKTGSVSGAHSADHSGATPHRRRGSARCFSEIVQARRLGLHTKADASIKYDE